LNCIFIDSDGQARKITNNDAKSNFMIPIPLVSQKATVEIAQTAGYQLDQTKHHRP
jgi:hypothetical protein